MVQGMTNDLIYLGIFIFFGGVLVLYRFLTLPFAVFVSGVKTGIWFFYFGYISTHWTTLDDLTYVAHGLELIKEGYTPITAWTDPAGVERMQAMVGGAHFLYEWWNMTAIYFFGLHYFSPVGLNVFITFISGIFFLGILKELEFSQTYQRWFLIFYLLHWDIVAWSSFLNFKDILVLTLTTISLYLFVKLVRDFKWSLFICLGFVLHVFSYIRFYIPVLFFLSIGFWVVFVWKDPKRYILLGTMTLLILYLIPQLREQIENNMYRIQPGGLAYGFFRFNLTPQPWSIKDDYTFLVWPSMVHWILFVPMLFGGWTLWKHSRYSKWILIYFCTILTFYSVFPGQQGPRHRVQVIPIIAWAQFHFLWMMVRSKKTFLRASAPPVG